MTLVPLPLQNLPEKPVSRLAPTPSGFLHLGNAVNFMVTWALVRQRGGSLRLRIDDMDGIRFRQDVLEDIFESLEWLGLDWDQGPQGPEQFYRSFSLQAKKEYYREQLQNLGRKSGKTFACVCSRSSIKKISASGLYPGTCRNASHRFIPGKTAVRLMVDDGCTVNVNGRRINLSDTFGDFVLWRKDDQPSYQLASLLEDENDRINLIIRGEDLLLSTAAQRYTADLFNLKTFLACHVLHHGLITGQDGRKLSKSRGAYALKDIRESGKGPQAAVRAAARVMGFAPDTMDNMHTARDLISPTNL